MIKEYVAKKALDAAYSSVKKALKKSQSTLGSSIAEIEDSINLHLRSVNAWSSEVSFSDIRSAKLTSEIFIELDLYVYPRYIRFDEQIQTRPLRSIFSEGVNHVILLGHPGAGKTTSMKYLCQQLFQDDKFPSDRFSFPLLIKLRDLHDSKISPSSMIVDSIYNILGLKIDFPEELQKAEASAERRSIKEKVVVNALEGLGVLLILDGFDELVDERKFDGVIKEVRYLTSHLERSGVILTSRTGDFKYRIDNAAQYEISPLTKEQILKFAAKWLVDQSSASDFVTKVYESPFADTAIRPLTLAHLCAIYERIGKIPDKPKTIYRKIINLLLEEWDQQRSVKRQSKYAHFEVDRKFEFLCQVAYVLTTNFQSTVFSGAHLLTIYDRIHENFELSFEEANQVISELETHTGLLLQSGYEQFEFAHKSLQEFLTAEHLVLLPSIPHNKKILLRLPNELAIAVTISSSPSDYFSELVLRRLISVNLSEGFVRSFLSRLFLEKPDFNSSLSLGLALVVLYTRYVETDVVVTDSQLRLFYYDAIFKEFDRILTLVLRRSSLDFIRRYYQLGYKYDMDDGNNLLMLARRKRTGKEVKLPIQFSHLPRTLYLRESLFIESTKANADPDEPEIPF